LELEAALKEFLGLENFWYTSNGTVPLQMAIKVLNIENSEIITTPFSYVATTNVIIWENNTPVFVDIKRDDFTIDPDLIEAQITPKTKAILATHVYGNPCEIDKIEAIAQKHNLKVIYDGAHAFGVNYKGKSVFSYGDISTVSFHATKVFHTTEGGGIIANHDSLHELNYWYRQFGHRADIYETLGINAKNSEFHAAMGLCVLPYWEQNQVARKAVIERYNAQLDWSKLSKPTWNPQATQNHAYYPVVLPNADSLPIVMEVLSKEGILPRRYFYPSLNTLKFLKNKQVCPVSEDITSRIICLPLYVELPLETVDKIAELINKVI
jgi:dTDP-4-amino-4,6-dideoxygalactose transaminase